MLQKFHFSQHYPHQTWHLTYVIGGVCIWMFQYSSAANTYVGRPAPATYVEKRYVLRKVCER